MNELHHVDICNKFFYSTKIKNYIAKQIKYFLCKIFLQFLKTNYSFVTQTFLQ